MDQEANEPAHCLRIPRSHYFLCLVAEYGLTTVHAADVLKANFRNTTFVLNRSFILKCLQPKSFHAPGYRPCSIAILPLDISRKNC